MITNLQGVQTHTNRRYVTEREKREKGKEERRRITRRQGKIEQKTVKEIK
jgi:hypothetical protein